MKKSFSLFLILFTFLMVGGCSKDAVTVYQTVSDDSISVRFFPWYDQNGGSVISTTYGLKEVRVTGGKYSNSEVPNNSELSLQQNVLYTVTWTYYNTTLGDFTSPTASINLNYASDINSLTIYLGVGNGDTFITTK